ncbi:MAG: GGDEF domain-containing protein [Bacillota bacterium]
MLNGMLTILYLYRRSNVLIANAIVLMVITAYSIYLNVGEFRVFVLYLFPAVPVISLFLTGKVKGSLYTVLALFITLFFLFTSRESWQATGFNYGSLVNFIVGNAAFFTLLLFYEVSVSESQKSLEATNKQLRIVSITDHLTQLYNREWLVGRMQSLIKEHRVFTIILGDLDDFKHVNDQHGHSEGDRVLKTIAGRMLDAIDEEDCSIGRYGGEEFLIIAENSDLDNAIKKAERIRTAITESPSDLKTPLTISFGVASFNWNDTMDSLVRRADQALYKSKKAGKNTVLSERALK